MTRMVQHLGIRLAERRRRSRLRLVKRNFTNWLRSRSRVGRFLYGLWNERLTPTGRFVLCGSAATTVAASFSTLTVGAPAFSAFAGIAIVSLVLSFARRPTVSVTRVAPERCVAGATVMVTMTIRNDGRRTLYDVGAFEYRLDPTLSYQEGPQYVAELAPGDSHTFTFRLRSSERGCYVLPGPAALVASPFGMMQARRFKPQPQPLIVYPAFHPITSMDVPAGQKYQPGGLQLTSHVGQSMEFIGNREYQRGDRVQDLHPRSWARVGYPVIKQYQEEYLTRVAVLVDTHLPRREVDDPFEANLSLAAAIADAMARQEYVIDLFAAGPQLYHFQAGRSLGYLDNILDILAAVQRCPTDPFEVVGPKLTQEIQQLSTIVLLLLKWDDRRMNLVRSLRDQGVMVKTILVTSDHAPATHLPVGELLHFTASDVKRGIETI